jgi:23S rRNA (cytidine1920-2'-O)/16S rRNA (cytidine1409-2'-O)-methyltransferase
MIGVARFPTLRRDHQVMSPLQLRLSGSRPSRHISSRCAALRRGQIDRGANRGLKRKTEKAAARRYDADLGLAPMAFGHQTLTKRPSALRASAARKLSASSEYGIEIIANVRTLDLEPPHETQPVRVRSGDAALQRRDLGSGFSLTMNAALLVKGPMRKRADIVLVERGFFPSRARAQAAIAAGLVSVGGATLKKASDEVAGDAPIEAEAPYPWASRGGVKLAAALDAFALDPAGLLCLDIGASTGGFTDVLLARGAAKVFAVDVGHGQLAPRLAAEPRVRSLEGVDGRALTVATLGAPPNAIVIDVSFIAQRLVLPHVLKLAAEPAWLVSLIKPQFELERADLVKGRVTNEAALLRACDGVRATIEAEGWTVLGLMPSPILGGAGAREFLVGARND